MRRFLFLTIMLVLIASLISSSFSTVFAQKKYNEAPILAELVKQGKISPLEQRLPKNPEVVKPYEEVGLYGGTLRLGLVGPADTAVCYAVFLNEWLVRWDQAGTKLVPSVAERYSISKDKKIYTFYLRKGMRWSDGTPFTADDILFWYEDVILNKELTPVFPAWLTTKSGPGKVEKVDSYTVRFIFADPYPLFLENQVWSGASIVRYPKHYLKEFHIKYVSKEKLEAMTKDAGFQFWYQLFGDRANIIQNAELPTISAWRSTGPLAGKTLHIMERNPYYWKIDTNGNQLPYIDKLSAIIVENLEVLVTKIINGEIDFDSGHMTLPNYPLLKENEKRGGYKALLWKMTMGSQLYFAPNLNHQDPIKRAMFNNRDFRIALSYAINREEINQLCYLGLAEVRHATVARECAYYTPGIDKLYTEYNPQKANELLDKVGLDKRDKSGYRLGPDGKLFTLTIEFPPMGEFGPWEDVVNLVVKYWNAVGLKVVSKPIDRSLYEVRARGIEIDFMVWAWGRGLLPLIQPHFVFPYYWGFYTGAPLYALWYQSGGKDGEKPSGDILKVMQLYDQFRVETNPAKAVSLGRQIIRISAENCWYIGTVGLAPTIVIAKDNLKNIPEKSFREAMIGQFAHTRPEQYFFKK